MTRKTKKLIKYGLLAFLAYYLYGKYGGTPSTNSATSQGIGHGAPTPSQGIG